jgi:putative endonuclease
LDSDTLVFIEVKTRWSKRFGPPEEAITPWKIKHIIKAGQYYQLLHPELPDSLRIDAVTVDLSPTGGVRETKIIKNLTG